MSEDHIKNIKNESLKYISDWQKRAKEQQFKYNIVLIAALIIAFVVCTVFTLRFRSDNYNRVVELNKKYIQDCSIQQADQLELRLSETKEQIKKYSKQYTLLMNNPNYKTVQERLNILCDRTLFDRVSFITLDGNDITVEGECDVSDRDYFKRAAAGKEGYEFILDSRITGEPILLFYAPVRQDEEIIGIMAGIYEYERIDKLLTYKFFNFSPETYLLDGKGTVIANSDDMRLKDNMFDVLSQKKFIDDVDYNEIQAAIADSDRTSVTFSFIERGKTSVGVLSQFNDSSWMILSILPNDVISPMINKANQAGRVMAAAIITVFALLIFVCMFLLRKRYNSLEKEMNITTDSLEKTSSHDQRQTFIVESLGNTYSSVYYAEIATNKYERIKELQDSSMEFPDKGSFNDVFNGYINKFVDAAYRDAMYSFMELSTFAERLGDDDMISIEYQRQDKGWRKGLMLPAERDENGKITSIIFAVQKIETEKRRELETQKALKEAYEAAQLASTAKTTFLSNMSHDIRTPMNAIVGMTAIASANLDNREKVSDCLKKITGASKHLLGLINEVLDMSKIESGKVDLSDEEFCLSDLIDELITMNQSLIKEKDHTLIVRVNSITHEKVIGDSTRLQQLLSNLLTNAIKYTPNGGRIEMIVTEKTTNKPTIGWYEIVFKDNGIGMSEEFQKKIFDPFSRADDSRISTIQGTGLGMAIARNIVRMMNGDLTVSSEINKGSTFTVSFALKLQNDESDEHRRFVDLPILVVDDDKSACESTCIILNSLSMSSEWVTNGRAAVKKVVERHEIEDDYYAVIIDWKMPDMDGIATTKEIRKQVGNDVPIIVLTAYDWSEIEEEAKAAGVNAFLSKPLFKSKLVNLFRGLAEEKHTDNTQNKELTEQDFSGKRILLAEDNELNREIATEILSMMGLEVESAENGKICCEMLNKSKPGYYDLIFMDIQMPVMNGYDAAKAIRSCEHPDAKKIPIVAMTANAFSADVRAAMDSGMNAHVSKPIEINNIVKILNELLK